MEKRTGITVPLSALYTQESEAAGDFLSLKKFADFCQECGLKVIQLLPVNDTGTQSSPYSGLSASALHPMYIRIDALPEFTQALEEDKAFGAAWKKYRKNFKYSPRFNYTELNAEKNNLLHLLYSYVEKKAASAPTSENTLFQEMEEFIQANPWIEIYAVYKNLKDSAMQASWKEWPENLQNLTRQQIHLRWSNKALKSSHNFFVWCQLRAAQQFQEAADYVRSLGIILKGDIPILMNEDSADAWAWPEYFSHNLRAGSPPDGENPMGQNWGFPTYNWKNLAQDDYTWWKDRIAVSSSYYSAFRIDHVLGFFRIWAVNHMDTTAYLGYTIPGKTISFEDLTAAGCDRGRINWLSKPHIPTSLIEDITWNHQEAVEILEKLCNRIGNEELWNFKETVTGDKLIYQTTFAEDAEKNGRICQALSNKWRDRALIEIEDDVYVPVYKYYESTAWNSLNGDEKQKLQDLFRKIEDEQNIVWKQQALDVLTPITDESEMVPCAEDLGVNLAVLPEVLQKLGILSLRVIRWSRNWNQDGQPYVPFEQYPELSVATTSVHDSSTLRQWWNEEKSSVDAYLLQHQTEGINRDMTFDETVAEFCLESSAKCNSAWFINPLQDYLFLDNSYYKNNPQDERINVPGSVNDFNWTYRIPCTVEQLMENKNLIEKIKKIQGIHDSL